MDNLLASDFGDFVAVLDDRCVADGHGGVAFAGNRRFDGERGYLTAVSLEMAVMVKSEIREKQRLKEKNSNHLALTSA